MKSYRRDLKILARSLRRSTTDAERMLWREVRRGKLHGLQFYRQKPLLDFIVDFYCPQARLVIELDGDQHIEADHAEQDRRRDDCLAAIGLRVLRFSNRQVLLEREAVLAAIEEKIRAEVLK